MSEKELRQPIVCVLGHVDHGKTSILDSIRGTALAKSEKGGITQRIGATEISREILEKYAGSILGRTKIRIPGLLFIDTPGHVAFANMRARGGALADIAVLVVDINEGLMPQTIESINILKKYKTPFIVAANKIDLIPMFSPSKSASFRDCLKNQREEWVSEFDKRFYELVGKLYELGFSGERYDRISDFSKTLTIVPTSAKNSIGIQDLLVMIAGLAQRFLESEISLRDTGPGAGTIIEVKKEESLGIILDTVLYQGTIKRSDSIVLNTRNGTAETRIKALLVNSKRNRKALDERMFVRSASAVRILIADKLDVIPGSPIYVFRDEKERQKAFKEMEKEKSPNVQLHPTGIHVKADALGSLEAVAYELSQKNINIRYAAIGDISRRDLVSASTVNDPMDRLVVGFNVSVLPDAKDLLESGEVDVITGDVIYGIVDECVKRLEQKKLELLEEKKHQMPVPSKLIIMPEYIFRSTKPVIVGIKVLAGRVKVGDKLLKTDGRYGGTVKSLRDGEVSKKFCDAPGEIAAAIDGVTLNRQIFPGETLYVDIPQEVVKVVRESDMGDDIKDVLEDIIKIKRKEDAFWGTRYV